MSPETVAALVGAGVGGGIGFFAQLGVLVFTTRRDRRAAAKLIFAELTENFAGASSLLEFGAWPGTTASPSRVAWETYGVRLVGDRGIARVGKIVSAYGRLDDIAWLARDTENFKPSDINPDWLRDIRLGLYEVGRLGGMTDRQLETSEILDDDVRSEHKEIERSVRAARRRWPLGWRR